MYCQVLAFVKCRQAAAPEGPLLCTCYYVICVYICAYVCVYIYIYICTYYDMI